MSNMISSMSDCSESDIFWKSFSTMPCNPYLLNSGIDDFKCLFIHLSKGRDFSRYDYPIAYGYMASLLRMNHGKAKILILDVDEFNKDSFVGYDLICFFPMVAMIYEMLSLTRKIKANLPDSKICLFNSEQHQHEMFFCLPKARGFAQIIMQQTPSIDFILVGEAEKAFILLCESIAKKSKRFAEIPSIVYRENGNIMSSEKPIEPVNFEYLPFPSRDFLENEYLPQGYPLPSVRIQSSRGCISKCLYCVESSSNIDRDGRKTAWLGRDIKKFVDEIELLFSRFKIIFFNVIDSSFEDPVGKNGIERMAQFCDEILKRKITASFKIHVRVETISKLDDNYLEMLKSAGVDILVIGVESGVERELRSYKKRTTVQMNIDNIKRLDKFEKFFPLMGHMMFSPYLELEDILKKVEFLTKINRGWDYLNMSNNLLVYPGTAYHSMILKDGLAIECEYLFSTVPYRYIDDRVKNVANEIGNLKIRCSEVAGLYVLLHDVKNIEARYYNKINRHLWENKDSFELYKSAINNILNRAQSVYSKYLVDLVELAKCSWSTKKADEIFKEQISDTIPKIYSITRNIKNNFIEDCESKGLSTKKLSLKTWMSLINSQVNTSGGSMQCL